MEVCDKCGPGTEAQVSFMTPHGPITFCRHHARALATAPSAYPSALVGRDTRARTAPASKAKPAWRGLMWRPE